ncbi:MAG: HipA N-terminal domain-containing protein [bacterium]|nr:HipA N-terminal domain-containing protein [bacterium]
MRRGGVYYRDRQAGVLTELDSGTYRFVYDPAYLADGPAVSVTLPLRPEPYESPALFPFFAGLVPEGWYLRIVARTIKVDERDTFGLLLSTCADCIGAVGVRKAADDAD